MRQRHSGPMNFCTQRVGQGLSEAPGAENTIMYGMLLAKLLPALALGLSAKARTALSAAATSKLYCERTTFNSVD
jgi:hypothetical protein